MEVMARGESGASVPKLVERKQAQWDVIDCVTTQNHRTVVKIVLELERIVKQKSANQRKGDVQASVNNNMPNSVGKW